MRLAILLSLSAWGVMFGGARAGDRTFHEVDIEDVPGYVVPEEYAAAHHADFVANIPGPVKIEGFWTPSDTSVLVADRVLRVMIHRAAKDPTLLFPELAPPPRDTTGTMTLTNSDIANAAELRRQRRELAEISANYADYSRQYVGVIIDKQRLIFCNYSIGTKADPTKEYVFTQTFFEVGGKVHFLQCRFDPEEKTCVNLSMIGPWEAEGN